MLVRHDANTWNQIRDSASRIWQVGEFFRERRGLYPKSVEDLVGEQSSAFYRSLLDTR